MQTYDLLMILVLVATTMFGFWKGFAWQVASLASLVASYFISLKFSPQLAHFFGDSEPWKLEWTTTARPHDWLFVFSQRFRARFLHWLKFQVRPALKRRA